MKGDNSEMVYEENYKESQNNSGSNNNGGNGGNGTHETSAVLAMAFVPRQKWQNIYKHDSGFVRGTIFADLDKPWVGRRGGAVR
jgi:hypothetical protein